MGTDVLATLVVGVLILDGAEAVAEESVGELVDDASPLVVPDEVEASEVVAG